jgi:hypothetical protein
MSPAKPNYQHARRQKEAARKARQQEKLARKLAKPPVEPGTDPAAPPADAVPSDTKDVP